MRDYRQMEFFQASTPWASPVPTFQILAEGQESLGLNPRSGRRHLDSLEMYHKRGRPPFVLLRMFQCCEAGDSMWSSRTFTRSGTMRSGIVYPLLPLQKLRTKGTESGLLPTPAAHEARLGYQDRTNGKKGTQLSLTTVVIDMLGGRSRVRGQIHPCLFEWMMGFPIGHTDCDS